MRFRQKEKFLLAVADTHSCNWSPAKGEERLHELVPAALIFTPWINEADYAVKTVRSL
jgi:hypothetical protein